VTERPARQRRVRTNLRLDGKLYAAARAVARQQGVTLTAFVEDCLRRRLGKRGPLDDFGPAHAPEPDRAVVPNRRDQRVDVRVRFKELYEDEQLKHPQVGHQGWKDAARKRLSLELRREVPCEEL